MRSLRRLALNRLGGRGSRAALAFMLTALLAGCHDDMRDQPRYVLNSEQEVAMLAAWRKRG